jgi:uncharacterized protein (DUF3084 family)
VRFAPMYGSFAAALKFPASRCGIPGPSRIQLGAVNTLSRVIGNRRTLTPVAW